MKKILCVILALVMLCMSLPVQAKAVTRHDASYVMPDDVDIWTDSNYIYVSCNGKTISRSFNYATYGKWTSYIVVLSTFTDNDGENVTLIQMYLSFRDVERKVSETVNTDSDDSSYSYIMRYSANGWNEYDPSLYYCYVKNNEISDMYETSSAASGKSNIKWRTYVENMAGDSEKPYINHVGKIYLTPQVQGKYKVFTDVDIKQGDNVLFPVNYLPAYSQKESNNATLPYRTTFRMLTEGAIVYNTFYYKSSFLSAADEISASGTIICDSVKLADGSVARTTLSAPQLLCQISTYGSAYDIVDTNDQNLCDLLGISMPDKKYWDVASQQWKTESSSGGSSSGGSSGGNGSSNIDQSQLQEDTASVAPITNLSVKFVGEDALIDPVLFNDYFANQVFHTNKLTDLNTKVWGLGAYLSWSYNGIKYETDSSVESGDSGALLTQTINQRRIKIVVKAKFRIDSSTTKTLVYTLYDFDNNKGIAVGAGSRRISFYDLCLFFQNAYPEYITDFPTQLVQIAYYLTPFYQDHETGKYVYGSTSHIAQNIASELADYSGGDWEGDNGGWSNENNNPFDQINNDLINWADDISDDVSNFGSVVGLVTNIVPTIKGLFSSLGQFPAMLAAFFPFIPAAFWEIICVGIVITGIGFVIKAFLSFLGAL